MKRRGFHQAHWRPAQARSRMDRLNALARPSCARCAWVRDDVHPGVCAAAGQHTVLLLGAVAAAVRPRWHSHGWGLWPAGDAATGIARRIAASLALDQLVGEGAGDARNPN
jgi:hypothetical protein